MSKTITESDVWVFNIENFKVMKAAPLFLFSITLEDAISWRMVPCMSVYNNVLIKYPFLRTRLYIIRIILKPNILKFKTVIYKTNSHLVQNLLHI